jgi:hypothetical protein
MSKLPLVPCCELSFLGKLYKATDRINSIAGKTSTPVYIKPFDLKAPDELIHAIYADQKLSREHYQGALDFWVPSRLEALALIDEAQQKVSVPGGGCMVTKNVDTGRVYPYINQMTPSDFSKSSQSENSVTHINLSQEGVVCHELLYMLSGTVDFFFKADEGLVKLKVCAGRRCGWVLVFRGDSPHGGNFSPQMKQLAVVVGPAEWRTLHFN